MTRVGLQRHRKTHMDNCNVTLIKWEIEEGKDVRTRMVLIYVITTS